MKKIIYSDLDNTLADYLGMANEMNIDPKDAKHIQGFFEKLQPISGAIEKIVDQPAADIFDDAGRDHRN